jgi:response regulator RpfG family c-di-GMP phosphodiesterase
MQPRSVKAQDLARRLESMRKKRLIFQRENGLCNKTIQKIVMTVAEITLKRPRRTQNEIRRIAGYES